MPTEQLGLEPAQAPLQRTSFEPRAARARRSTGVPARNCAEQLGLQETPVGVLRTMPRPRVVTASGKRVPASTKVATAARGAAAVTRQVVATPLQAPLQPENRQPSEAAATSPTAVRMGYDVAHAGGQSMPPASLFTLPFPRTATATGYRCGAAPPNEATSAFGPSIVSAHAGSEPEHAPDQESPGPAAFKTRRIPLPNAPSHTRPQSIPGTSLVTVPPPAVTTASGNSVSGGAKVAVADFGLSIVTEHVGWPPEQLPPHPEKDQPGVGTALSVTTASAANEAVHVVPQLTPAGLLVTVPLPLVDTASEKLDARTGSNRAVTWYTTSSLISLIVQEPDPEQTPLQPANCEPGSALAVNVTGWKPSCLWEGNGKKHVAPQSIPGGLLVTVPEPPPSFETEMRP
jgi:hypothetical protein